MRVIGIGIGIGGEVRGRGGIGGVVTAFAARPMGFALHVGAPLDGAIQDAVARVAHVFLPLV